MTQQTEQMTEKDNIVLIVYDYTGFQEVIKTKSNKIDLSARKPGIYVIKAIVNEKVITLKVIK